MEEIISFEFSNGSKLLDSNGFVAVHKNNTETAYIKAPYMKFCTGRHA
ncbi:hypothetical protein [Lactiplantibacillus plantarum]|nr:hypothetical protein [Lactiplantibacillus plantarum]MBP5835069.1 hypothetical protein [Lactiplantibacillus plantarum]QAR88143.1 hypothetical protein EQJ03_01780 [Lactiplantibacillus plantarum]WKF81359.1 hypothetical protein QY876_09500 [Lactiplantibacillus plantarum]WKF87131.1 hypothetical protein QY875_12460 [Lactiplantibacillus plantarum]